MRLIRILVTFIFLSSVQSVNAADLNKFLKYCGYGVLGGVGAGVISLAFVDSPSEHMSNISKGASLGLYLGIGYGIYQLNYKEQKEKADIDQYGLNFHILPNLKNRQLNFQLSYNF